MDKDDKEESQFIDDAIDEGYPEEKVDQRKGKLQTLKEIKMRQKKKNEN